MFGRGRFKTRTVVKVPAVVCQKQPAELKSSPASSISASQVVNGPLNYGRLFKPKLAAGQPAEIAKVLVPDSKTISANRDSKSILTELKKLNLITPAQMHEYKANFHAGMTVESHKIAVKFKRYLEALIEHYFTEVRNILKLIIRNDKPALVPSDDFGELYNSNWQLQVVYQNFEADYLTPYLERSKGTNFTRLQLYHDIKSKYKILEWICADEESEVELYTRILNSLPVLAQQAEANKGLSVQESHNRAQPALDDKDLVDITQELQHKSVSSLRDEIVKQLNHAEKNLISTVINSPKRLSLSIDSEAHKNHTILNVSDSRPGHEVQSLENTAINQTFVMTAKPAAMLYKQIFYTLILDHLSNAKNILVKLNAKIILINNEKLDKDCKVKELLQNIYERFDALFIKYEKEVQNKATPFVRLKEIYSDMKSKLQDLKKVLGNGAANPSYYRKIQVGAALLEKQWRASKNIPTMDIKKFETLTSKGLLLRDDDKRQPPAVRTRGKAIASLRPLGPPPTAIRRSTP